MSGSQNLVWMFRWCSTLTTLDVSDWDVSNVINFGEPGGDRGVFQGCSGLTSLDCSGWRFNTTSSVSFQAVFKECSNLTTIGDISGWNTNKITTFQNTFQGCTDLVSLNVGGFDVSNVIDFSGMFAWVFFFNILGC